jgi:hypothetical protein
MPDLSVAAQSQPLQRLNRTSDIPTPHPQLSKRKSQSNVARILPSKPLNLVTACCGEDYPRLLVIGVEL